MSSRHIVAALSLAVMAGFLVLFASHTPANATTYNMTYRMTLGCNGADGVASAVGSTLSANAAAGATSITVANPAGMVAGVVIVIGPSASGVTDIKTITSGGGNPVSFAPATLSGAHASGEPVTSGDDSCVAGTQNNPAVTADTTIVLQVPAAGVGQAYESNYQNIFSFHAPTEWITGRDDQAPFGTYSAVVVSGSTLSLLNAACPEAPNVTVTIPLYNCSTDNSVQNTIQWVGDGTNLLQVNADGLPEGCVHYPSHVQALTNNAKPRSRLFGEVTVVPGAVPTQLEFVVYNPGQITQFGGGLPFSGMIDTLGYSNAVILDNPSVAPSPGATPNTVTEFCAPMLSNTTTFGKSQGRGTMIPAVGTGYGSETTVQCYNGLDDDGDGVADDGCWEVLPGGTLPDQRCSTSASNPQCGIPGQKNPLSPAANVFSGVLGTGSHLVGVYSESWRDKDGDGFPNIDDACPYVAGVADLDGSGSPNIRGADGCPAAPSGPINGCGTANNDCDGDGLMNRQDTCPFVIDTEGPTVAPAPDNPLCPRPYNIATCISCGANNVDNDNDAMVNDGCPQVGTTAESGAQCANNTDDDGDGAINDGCPAFISTDADKDNIGFLCDSNDNPLTGGADGAYLNVERRASVCVGQTDTDGDGWCDTTEALLGSIASPAGAVAAASTPENSKIDIALTAAETPPGQAKGTCADQQYYDTAGAGGAAVDNDGDTLINAADPDCVTAAPITPTLPPGAVTPLPGAVTKDVDCIRFGHLRSNTTPPSSFGGWFQTVTPAPGDQPFPCDTTGPLPIPVPGLNPVFVGNIPEDELDKSSQATQILKTVTLTGITTGPTGVACLVGTDGNAPGAGPAVVGPVMELEPEAYSTDSPAFLALAKFSLGLPAVPANQKSCDYRLTVTKVADTGFGPLSGNTTVSITGMVCADSDGDGVFDNCPGNLADNCPAVPNPEQLNTDAKVGTTPPTDPSPSALQGDACDADDDQDGATDVVEWAAGTDPKDPCNTPYPTFDVTGGTPGVPDGTINTLDIITITKLLNKKCRLPSVAQVQ